MSAASVRASKASVLGASISAQRWRVLGAAALFAGHQAGEALVPVLIGVVIDRATGPRDVGALLLWLGVLAVDFAVLSFSWRFGMRVGTQAAVRADRDLKLAVAARSLHPRGSRRADLPGALVSIATADVRRTAMINFRLPHLVAAIAGMLVAGIWLLVVSVPLGLLILLGTPPLLFLVNRLSAPLERRTVEQQERAARAAAVAVDLVRGVRVLKGLGAERAGLARYRAVSRDSLDATLATTRVQAVYSGAVVTLNGLFLALIALVGGRMAASGTISVGELVSAVGLAQFLVGPLGVFGDITAALAAGRASAGRIGGVLHAEPATPGGEGAPVSPVAGEVAVRGLTGGGLAGADFTVAPGETVAVCCADPAAASALVRYLGRQADPDAGDVTLDGRPLADLAPDALRTAILAVPQGAALFEGTVAANIDAGRGGDITAAVRAARADEVASALPDGLATAVAERGNSLSGGQRQRVALARALHADPPVLVLHDPTNAVDTVTEAGIGDGLRALRARRTTIIVTSSPALLAAADRVLLVKDGTVAAAGPHGDLLDTRPDYRELVLT
ncbi:ABC transporter ATP-binding protein [Actinocorallia sp. A-T 12471]|uniref:ABC transporter ATP-binding protein n=1 Tax=Actinocorallia sp. A-T 12471 TaxID=3089813 RepID=UPI0029D0FD57|nr:ABC transporter ATP-binding protein [Actinocorallia sp. A-T 12471]MDX6744039.1 ABC transporter ATP-binding protein [Actinocorallia sp. A-T 12471]